MERDDRIDKESSSEDDIPLHSRDQDECDSILAEGPMCTRPGGEEKELSGAYTGEEKERDSPKNLSDQTLDREMKERNNQDDRPRQAETDVITRASSPFENRLMENHCENNLICHEANEERVDREHANSLHAPDKFSELKWDEGEHRSEKWVHSPAHRPSQGRG